MKKRNCIDCRKIITGHANSQRCHSCANKFNWKKRNDYKNGITIIPHFCINCKKQITKYAIRCLSCFHNQNICNYIDGRTLKKYYCKDCNKKISKTSGIYGKGRCLNCANKLKIVSNKTKRILSKIFFGKSNPNWQGGIQNLPYSFEFDEKLKEKIRKRDNYQCQNKECNMTEEEHLIVYGKVLTIHHIDYNKKNPQKNNLISLCIPCNFRVNYNRPYWIDYFKAKTVKYICGEDKL